MAKKPKGPPKVPLAVPPSAKADYPEPGPPTLRRRIQAKPLAALLVLVGLIGVGVHFLHGFQVNANADSLLTRADEVEESEPAKAAGFLRQYIGLVPDDLEARQRYAFLLDEIATTPRAKFNAFLALEQVLQKDSSRDKVRRASLQAALAVGRYSDARDHLLYLLAESPKDAELEHLLGLAQQGNRKFTNPDLGGEKVEPFSRGYYEKCGAKEAYEAAIAHDPKQVKSYVALAYLYRRRLEQPNPVGEKSKDDSEADLVIKKMRVANGDDPEAQIAQIRYLRDFDPEGYRKELQDKEGLFKRLAPKYPEVVLLVAELELAGDAPDKARTHLKEGLRLHPEEVGLYHLLARVELQEGHPDKAREHLHTAEEHLGDNVLNLWTTADLLISADAPEKEVRALMGKVRRAALTEGLVEYLEGRLLARDKEWAPALARFEKARHILQAFPEVQRLALWRAGLCHRALGNIEGQAFACEAALETDRSWLPALLSLASAREALGEPERALPIYRALAGRTNTALLAAVRLMLAANARREPGNRDWARPGKLLEEAPAGVKEDLEWKLLHIRLLAARGQPGDAETARTEAEKATREHPKEADAWLALAGLYLARPEDRTQVPALLDKADEAAGKNPALWLARLRYFQLTGKPEEGEKLIPGYEKEAEALPREDRVTWLRGLGGYYRLRGKGKEAEGAFTRLIAIEPKDLNAHIFLFEAALSARDHPLMAERLAKIREVEGSDGAYTPYGEALLILTREKPPASREELGKAKEWLAQAGERRPNWARVATAEGDLYRRLNEPDKAIEKYEKALDLGDRRLVVVRYLLALLNRQGKSKEVVRVIHRWRNLFPANQNDASRLEIQALVRLGGDTEGDVEGQLDALAGELGGSKDFHDHLWVGQMYWALGKDPKAKETRGKAEKAFRKAIALAPEEVSPRVTLVLFLTTTDRLDDAKKEIQAASDHLPRDKATTALALAACYEAVGDKERAKEGYGQALKANPNDPTVLQAVALYHLSKGEFPQAIPLLRRLKDGGKGDTAWARRVLGLTLATTGDYQQSREGLRYIEENLREDPSSAPDQRAKALVLARQPVQRRQALKYLETSFNRVPPNPTERFLRARLYRAAGDWTLARNDMISLLDAPGGDNPVYLAVFIRWLLDRKEVPLARVYLNKLKDKEPDSRRTLSAKARVRLAEGKDPAEVRQLVKAHVDADKKDPGRLLAAGLILDEIRQPEAAEPYFRDYFREAGAKEPKAVLPLVRHLAQNGQVSQAIDTLRRVSDRLSKDLLGRVGVMTLRATEHPSGQDQALVEGWLKQALKGLKDPNDRKAPVLLLALANLRDQQGRFEEAGNLYREVLKRDPKNIIALNNLAILMALRFKKPAEGSSLIGEAIKIAGPVPELLDSRAVVLLQLGDTRQAARDLNEVLAVSSNPASTFRLAWVQFRAGDRNEAARTLRKAREAGLKKTDLHPLEFAAYQEVTEALARN
jgi:tetratricopeptide (TPR) repeat protein